MVELYVARHSRIGCRVGRDVLCRRDAWKGSLEDRGCIVGKRGWCVTRQDRVVCGLGVGERVWREVTVG